MKIGVVGCGALGSFYGAKLLATGEEVHFLLRSDYEAVRRTGVRVRSMDGDFHVSPRCADRPEEIGICDLVLIGLKTTANHEFPSLLSPLVGSSTAVLTLQNGLGNEEQLAELFGTDRVMGGLCFVCLNRSEPGVIQHIAQGLVTLGEFRRPAQPRTVRIGELFRRAGVPCELRDDLERAHWEKLVWNVPFNGLGVASAAGYRAILSGDVAKSGPTGPCLTTDILLSEPRWERLVHELMSEVIATAHALGFSMSVGLADELIARTRSMGAYKPSTLIDFERRQALELESLFLRPLSYAKRSHVAAPRLAALCEVLKLLDPGSRSY